MNCPICKTKTKNIKKLKIFNIDIVEIQINTPYFSCPNCDFEEIDTKKLRKIVKSIEYKKPMSSSSKKAKGNKLEKKVAEMLHNALMEYCQEYKDLYIKLDNPLLKPKKEKSSGAGVITENTNDVELGIAQPFFPFSIEAKFHACMIYSINNILAGGMSEIFEAWKQAENHSKHHKKLSPLVVFKANGTKIFCLTKETGIVYNSDVDYIKKDEFVILLYSDFLKLYLEFKNERL